MASNPDLGLSVLHEAARLLRARLPNGPFMVFITRHRPKAKYTAWLQFPGVVIVTNHATGELVAVSRLDLPDTLVDMSACNWRKASA